MDEAKNLLQKFSYATRKSSSSFCEKLIEFKPDYQGEKLDVQILNQSWFFSSWKNDPTIASMLVMLREIGEKFHDLTNVWIKLSGENPRIVFHLLPMKDLGLPDDLYIKMNARGKELTDFEHFKSQFSEILNDEQALEFNEKIDKEWSDLFWNIFKNKESKDIAKEVDNGFSGFFWYITNILITRNKIEHGKTYWLDIINAVYQNSSENVKFIFDAINLFEDLEKNQPNYFDDLFYVNSDDFSLIKTRIFFSNPHTNLFRKCAEFYGFGERKNLFSVGEQLLLYAFIYMKNNVGEIDPIKFRKLRNIFASSEFQLRNEFLGTFLYDDVESLILNDCLSSNSKLSKRQFEEEVLKNKLLTANPFLTEIVYQLEDHNLLRGNIALFDFTQDIKKYGEKFLSIFNPGCDYFQISKALLTFGDYTQAEGKFKRFGNNNNSTWREIFTESENRNGFDNTKEVVKKYLDYHIKNNVIDIDIIENYLKSIDDNQESSKDLRYYYLKYSSFSKWTVHQTNGYYCWDNAESKPYECWMLFKTQFNGRHWSPFLLELSTINNYCELENYGNQLKFVFGEYIIMISNQNNGFKFTGLDDVSINFVNGLSVLSILNADSIYEIKQNSDGIDLLDRVTELNEILNELVTLKKA
jgi:hypothetical protein